MLANIRRLAAPIIFFAIALLITLIVGISRTNLEVVVFKFLIFCPSITLVHLSRKVMFPYIDLRDFVHGSEDTLHQYEMTGPSIRDAAVILGVFLYYVVLTYALTQAI